MLSLRARIALGVQRTVAHVLFPLLGPLIVLGMHIRGYRIEQGAELRRRFRELTKGHRGPVLVCSNHMTEVDSALLVWALAPTWTYLIRFHRLPWNIPEWKKINRNIGLRFICYLGKCVPIVRDGPPEEKRESLARLEYLLRRGESVAIFPEGARSRTGKLDMENFGYGTGQLWTRAPDARVLCVYLRGREQHTYGTVPVKGDRFYTEIELVDVQTEHRGLRAARDVTCQVMNTLQEMEERYFAWTGSAPAEGNETSERDAQIRDRSA